jgi:nucleoside-diphosphate-sugar epimerase
MTDTCALITGYPNFVVKQLVHRLADDNSKVFLLCKAAFENEARKEFAPFGRQVHIITGDVVCMDLGLSGDEVKEVRREVTHLFHLAGIYYLGSDEDEMSLVNIEGTRNVLSFAREMDRLERFLHYSTAFVSGNREGVILEDELIEPMRFRNPFERTKFMAEKLVRRAMNDLPITIVRPSLIVGDSVTGKIDNLDGPHFFLHVLVNLPLDIHLPLVGKGAFPLNIVPVDYVVNSMVHLSGLPEATGMTFHLVDVNPLPAIKVFEVLCRVADKKPPRRSIPSNLATYLMKMPGLKKSWRSPRLFVEMLNQLTLYNAMNTTEVLRDSGIICPSFPSYVSNLVDFMKRKK